jgi:putative sigma-54 modulation protein
VKVVVHDRTGELPADLRAYAERKVSRLSRHFDRVAEAEVEFEMEKGGPGAATMARITVRTAGRRHALVQAGERSHNPQMALQLAVDKIDRQMVKLKEKIKLRSHRAAPPGSTEGA